MPGKPAKMDNHPYRCLIDRHKSGPVGRGSAQFLNIKTVMDRIFKFLLLFVLGVSLAPLNGYATGNCLTALSETVVVESGSVLWSGVDNIPLSAERILKPVDQVDVTIMLHSFENRKARQPVEAGIVEILDGAGKLLYASDLITGDIASISLGSAVTSAFAEARKYPNATMIRYRHTHPPAVKGHGAQYRVAEFSSDDVQGSETLNRYKNAIRVFRQLSLEVVITHVAPAISEFELNAEELKKILKTKSYRFK